MKNDIINNYYNRNELKKMIKQRLGNAYTGDIDVDFENFIVKITLEEIGRLEEEK